MTEKAYKALIAKKSREVLALRKENKLFLELLEDTVYTCKHFPSWPKGTVCALCPGCEKRILNAIRRYL